MDTVLLTDEQIAILEAEFDTARWRDHWDPERWGGETKHAHRKLRAAQFLLQCAVKDRHDAENKETV